MTLEKSDSMYFLNTKDIKNAIWSMAEKFAFHGFFKHADYLKTLHEKYIIPNLPESDLNSRLNVVKFLLCMSQSPTTHFWESPEKFQFIYNTQESEVLDWGAYLTEDIDRWSPLPDENSDSEDETTPSHQEEATTSVKSAPSRAIIPMAQHIKEYNFQESRKKLLNTIQTDWWSKPVIMEPPSDWFDANVGLLWHQHLLTEARGLVTLDPLTVISEYKVMREILWQMWGPHNSVVFQLSGNKLVPKPNVTISSIRASCFYNFMEAFIPYIQVLDDFRQFYRKLETNGSETYKSYSCGVKNIVWRVFEELVLLESEIAAQETTMTLIKLSQRFEIMFKPVFVLKAIHNEVIIDNFGDKTPLECALVLLTRLRTGLEFSVNKLEQDIRLSLYLESIYYYLLLTEAWLVKNDLFDHTNEFIVLNENSTFVLRAGIEEYCDQDSIIKIISNEVLNMGRNMHLLRLLRKYDVFTKKSETIHQEYTRRLLEELCSYYSCEPPSIRVESPQSRPVVTSFDLNGMGDWTNFVDTTDGFLMEAFSDFFYEKEEIPKEDTLYEKISKITTNLFPFRSHPEKIFLEIMKERFNISGLMVKNLLIEKYNLDKQFDFLNHIFLFNDDLIFPFYRRLFEKMNLRHSNWGNSVYLTSHLQDSIMDLYPNFYEDCIVQIKDTWKQCRDSLKACSLLTLHYEIKWPLNIIITNEQIIMYKEIFEVVLQVKWALYTANHLFFTDIEPKNKSFKAVAPKSTIERLKYLRFNLINILNSIQHYLFGFVFTKHRIQFELDFEKSNDLKSLITSHEEFIKSVYCSVKRIREESRNNHGFNTLLKCVRMLKVMWNQPDHATGENLNNCHKIFKSSFEVVNETVTPIFDL
ncbi:gamma-tubulin complex component 5-like isoform X2 [Tribolium madens]|nr:gamma-tubulin complex component 5-like isoform X2 [Tribolium madens]